MKIKNYLYLVSTIVFFTSCMSTKKLTDYDYRKINNKACEDLLSECSFRSNHEYIMHVDSMIYDSLSIYTFEFINSLKFTVHRQHLSKDCYTITDVKNNFVAIVKENHTEFLSLLTKKDSDKIESFEPTLHQRKMIMIAVRSMHRTLYTNKENL